MKLVITTQIHENYGAHAWDGEGECPQHWKAKGGENYVVHHLTPEQAIEATKPGGLADRVGAAVTVQDNPAFEEYVLGGTCLTITNQSVRSGKLLGFWSKLISVFMPSSIDPVTILGQITILVLLGCGRPRL